MSYEPETGGRGRDWRPSKALWFWSLVGAVVLTLIVGFTWGGWVTGGTLAERLAAAEEDARTELAAAVCVERVLAAADARARIAALEEESSWQRGDLIEEGGWVSFAGYEEPLSEAADLCAERLLEAELPPAAEAAIVEDAEVLEETTVIEH